MESCLSRPWNSDLGDGEGEEFFLEVLNCGSQGMSDEGLQAASAWT